MKDRVRCAISLALVLFLSAAGCYSPAVVQRDHVPGMVWPKPPDIPRITYVRSLPGPGDPGVPGNAVMRFFRRLAGIQETPLVHPHGLYVGDAGTVYVADTATQTVHIYRRENAGHSVLPTKDVVLRSPVAAAVDETRGRVYVADSASSLVRIFSLRDAAPAGGLGTGALERPSGLAINRKSDELLVADAKKAAVFRFSLTDHRLTGVIGKKGEGAGAFNSPTHVFASADGTIYVTDSLNFRIQVFAADGAFLRSFGAAGDGPGYFARPKGVAADSDGNVYVVDALFDNVQVFDGQGRLLMSFGGPGSGPGEFWLPSGVFIDGRDRIYVSDSFNKRVQVFQYLKGGDLPE